MCYSNPAKSLEIARSRLTPEQWAKFEREFDDFCVVQGLPDKWAYWSTYDWAKWAYFSAGCYEAYDNGNLIADAYFEKIAIAMMTDEQAEASLERWMGEGK